MQVLASIITLNDFAVDEQCLPEVIHHTQTAHLQNKHSHSQTQHVASRRKTCHWSLCGHQKCCCTAIMFTTLRPAGHLAQLESFIATLGITTPSLAVPVSLPALDPNGQHHAQAQEGSILEEDLDHRVLPGRPLQAHSHVCLATSDEPWQACKVLLMVQLDRAMSIPSIPALKTHTACLQVQD